VRRSSQLARAVRAAQILNPDLVVLDLAMPVMNGLDAARMLRRIMPAVPLIMYCGFGDKFVEQQARSHLINASAESGSRRGEAFQGNFQHDAHTGPLSAENSATKQITFRFSTSDGIAANDARLAF